MQQLALTDVLPADVLLSRGVGNLADMIVAADRGSYSHASLWSGTGVVEATLDGIAERPLGHSRDVYRYVRDGKPLEPATRAAIVETARRYTGASYAHGELLMLGILFAMGRRPARPLLEAALELFGGPRAVELARFIEQHLTAPGREPMVCSELVARAYYEVGPSHAYALHVSPARPHADTPAPRERGAAPVLAANDASDSLGFAQLEERCRALLASPSFALGAAPVAVERKVLFGEIAIDSVTRRQVPVVTPGDLQFCTDLQLVGRILPA